MSRLYNVGLNKETLWLLNQKTLRYPYVTKNNHFTPGFSFSCFIPLYNSWNKNSQTNGETLAARSPDKVNLRRSQFKCKYFIYCTVRKWNGGVVGTGEEEETLVFLSADCRQGALCAIFSFIPGAISGLDRLPWWGDAQQWLFLLQTVFDGMEFVLER